MHVALLKFIFIALTCFLVQCYKIFHYEVSLSDEWSAGIYVLMALVLIWSLLSLKPLYIYW